MSTIYGRKLTDGSVLQYIASIDITAEREEQEKQAAIFTHTNALLERVLATTQTALFWKDKERRFQGANKAFLDYYDFPSEEVILGKTDEDMGWHEDEEPFKSDEWRILHMGESTYRVRGKCMSHGEMRDIVASKSPLIENGEIVGLVGSFEDVTDEICHQEQVEQLNEQLRHALDKAESANQAKTAFLSNVSHDMRTPLNGILGITELALKTNDIDKIRGYLQKIMTAGSLLKDLINDTLELSRIGSGKKKLDYEVVEASSMLDRLITSIRSAAEQNGVNFHVDLPFDELGFVRTDRLKLSKVLLNLLSNAIKYTPAGGSVTMCMEGPADFGAYNCHIVISDTGVGMDKSFLPKLFEPFAQERTSITRKIEGTGLGMSIVKSLVDLMGGKITVDSERGKGTRFDMWFFLPPGQTSEAAEVPVDGELMQLVNRRILLCEDNEINRELMQSLLSFKGIEVIAAGDGQQGVAAFANSPEGSIDAVLMDVRMPIMDGLEAARAIRAMSRDDARHVPIFALTGEVDDESVQKAKAAGMNECLSKPVDIPVLLQRLAAVMT
jgi:PAS domain S-box-containing protein